MTTRSERRRKQRAKQKPTDANGEQPTQQDRYHPKPGPGQVFKRELIGAETGHAKRYRNIGATPLVLAFQRHALECDVEKKWRRDPRGNPPPAITAQDRLDCGEKFEKWWYNKMASPCRDSTIQGIGGGGQRTLTEVQERADRQIVYLRTKLSARNYLIVEAFCGEGHSMLDALRRAGVEAHPVGTAYRIREALDDLVCVITGRMQVPLLVPKTA